MGNVIYEKEEPKEKPKEELYNLVRIGESDKETEDMFSKYDLVHDENKNIVMVSSCNFTNGELRPVRRGPKGLRGTAIYSRGHYGKQIFEIQGF